jgi:hypothetical protein
MGSPDVRSFSRNKRGCAGSLIWVNFDRHALLNLVRQAAGTFLANVDGTIDQSSVGLFEVSGFKEEAAPWYSDQIIPFDVTVAGTNELGAAMAMKIFGVEILDEGSGCRSTTL